MNDMLVDLGFGPSEDAIKVSKAGLDYMYDNFEFIRDGKTYKLNEALKKFTGSFETMTIQGTKPKPASFDLEV